jgi:hypothetical protein
MVRVLLFLQEQDRKRLPADAANPSFAVDATVTQQQQ